MSTVAEFTMPVTALPAGDALTEFPDMQIEVERIVPTQESALPFFWVWGPEPDAFLEYAESEPDMAEVDLLDHVDGGALFRAEWMPDADLVRGIRQLDATIIEAIGTSDHWRFELRTQDKDAFREFQEVFRQHGIPVELDRLYDLAQAVEDDIQPVTPEQRETLLAAYRDGYFEKPRETTQEELSQRFDVSSRAISDRLRRGIRNLIASSLLPARDH